MAAGVSCFQVRLAAGDLTRGARRHDNLLQIARRENNDDRLADAAALKARVLELLGRPDEAIAAYREICEHQRAGRTAAAGVVEGGGIGPRAGAVTNASQSLEEFRRSSPNSPVRDICC